MLSLEMDLNQPIGRLELIGMTSLLLKIDTTRIINAKEMGSIHERIHTLLSDELKEVTEVMR